VLESKSRHQGWSKEQIKQDLDSEAVEKRLNDRFKSQRFFASAALQAAGGS